MLPRVSNKVTESYSKSVLSILDTSVLIKHKISNLVTVLYYKSLSLPSMPLTSWLVIMMMRLLTIPRLSCLIVSSMNSPVILVAGTGDCVLDYWIILVNLAASSRASIASCMVKRIRGWKLSLQDRATRGKHLVY